MNLREILILLEKIERTGKGDTAVIGWGRGMGHKGHMYLASSVITHAKELGGDPYFVVSRTSIVDPSTGKVWSDPKTFTKAKDDPITPEEKLAIYKKVFPDSSHIFQTATDELPDLTKVLRNLNQQGYKNAVVIVGADQVKAFQYLNAYNGKPNKSGEIPFDFDNLQVISRQETNDPSKGEEGPRATPMRQVLLDPTKSDAEQFAVWRDAMNPEISDDEVRNLMNKAKERMMNAPQAPKKSTAKKKEPAVAESAADSSDYEDWMDVVSNNASGDRALELIMGIAPKSEWVNTIRNILTFAKQNPNDVSPEAEDAIQEIQQAYPKLYQIAMTGQKEVEEHIVKVKGGYELKSKHGNKNLGKYPTKAGAEKRERQVQFFKHAGESVAEDWQKVNKSDKTDGMSKKAVDAYRRENPGSKLKTAVTKKPSELKAGSKDANRRKSFCARMSGVKGPMKDEKGRPTAKAKALSRWNCNEDIEVSEDMISKHFKGIMKR